jgi:FMN phosphatase YigB (HAD superfamily)
MAFRWRPGRCRAGEVLFLDDNLLNVDGAKKVGIKAIQVKGVLQAEQALVDAGVLETVKR